MRHQTVQTFIVSVWKKTPGEQNWHWRIQNVRTGKSEVVANLDELTDLFRRHFQERTKVQQGSKRGLK